MNPSMQSKTILITGATSGIGFVAARELARMGAQIVVVSRDAARCAAAVSRIKSETSNQQVEYIAADLSTRAGVENVASEYKRRFSRLDVLLNNAGAMFMTRKVSKDGVEMTLALNHLSYFHLTILLLDLLKASQPARIINVSSDAHQGARLNLADLQLSQGYTGFGAYSQSKLANLLFTYELARQLQGQQVTCNALHPGFVASGFGKNNGGLIKLAMAALRPFQKSLDDGARTSIYLASSPEVENISGKYFTDCKIVPSSFASQDQVAAAKLWECSQAILSNR